MEFTVHNENDEERVVELTEDEAYDIYNTIGERIDISRVLEILCANDIQTQEELINVATLVPILARTIRAKIESVWDDEDVRDMILSSVAKALDSKITTE